MFQIFIFMFGLLCHCPEAHMTFFNVNNVKKFMGSKKIYVPGIDYYLSLTSGH